MEKVPVSNFNEIEKMMVSSLQPVAPRPEFVTKLRQRLTDPTLPTVRFTHRYSTNFILLILASVLSGVVFFLTTSRVIISLIREFNLSR